MSSGLTTPLEQMKPISQALEIIEKVKKIARDIWVNKHQCKRVLDRFEAIGNGLSDLNFGGANIAYSTLDYSAFDELLTTLQKGEVLISDNVEWNGIKGVVSRTDNREAFKEIHEDLDTMKATFPFEGFSGYFETSTGIQRSVLLAQDADKDLEEMKNLPDIEKSVHSSEKPEAMDLEKLSEVVLEKAEAKKPRQDSGDLPSYLKIDMSVITIKEPVRELRMLSTQESKETYGRTLVREGSWLGCEFAAKVFKSDEPNWNKEQLLKEVGALMELRHPHIILFIGFAEDEDAKTCYLLMEMMRERDLRELMKQRPGRPFTPTQELDIITQIAKGMLYLHTQGYAHGDLKCSNILVKNHGDYIEVKIGDLRFSQKLESAGGSWKKNVVQRPRWTPLEALNNYGGVKPTDKLLKQANVYSFAMTCYEVVTGNLPFQGVQGKDLLDLIWRGERPKLPKELNSGLKGLIESCWDSDPNKRPKFKNICVILDHIKSKRPGVINKVLQTEWRRVPKSLCGLLCLEQGAQTSTRSGNMRNQSGSQVDIPECLKIKSKNLKEMKKIGTGGSAEVYEVTWLGCRFAVKRMRLNDKVISALLQELDFLIKLRHPYIIQIVGFSDDDEQRCSIVMEYMNGNLRELIDSRMKAKAKVTKTNSLQPVLPFEFHEVVSIIKQLALGIAFLHSKGVVHRDLKSNNVLCQEHAGCIDAKIVDFGISEYIAATNGVDGVVGAGPIGTRLWRAPEILQIKPGLREGDVDLKAADVYSFAVMCDEIVTGRQPFSEYGKFSPRIYDRVVKGLRPTLPSDMDAGLKKLIEDCWEGDPKKRPEFAEVCTRIMHCHK